MHGATMRLRTFIFSRGRKISKSFY